MRSESWEIYWHNVRDYRADYYSRTAPWRDRVGVMLGHLAPWSWLNVPALVGSAFCLVRAVRGRRPATPEAERRLTSDVLLAAFAVGWTLQANFVQSQLNYHLASALLPTLARTVDPS